MTIAETISEGASPTPEQIRSRYQDQFGVGAGYLPGDPAEVTRWLTEKLAQAEAARTAGELLDNPAVAALGQLVTTNSEVGYLFEKMLEWSGGQREHGSPITSLQNLLNVMNLIVVEAPVFTDVKAQRNFFPMSSLFVHMMYAVPGMLLMANDDFNDALRAVLQSWCDYLDSPESLYVVTPDGWLSGPATRLMDLKDFVIPDPSNVNGGFVSFNAFFHREIKLKARQLAGANDPTVIVSANDGTVYRIARNVARSTQFWLKGQPYSLENMLNNIDVNGVTVDSFVRGDVFQSFLSGSNYHRWRAPVSGTIIAQELVPGFMFSELPWPGYDDSAGTKSQGYQASVNTRGLVFIKADHEPLGVVCVMPIGITEISSIRFCCSLYDHVDKGDELGYFSYGGSTLCVVFQPGVVGEFRWEWPPPPDPSHPNCPACPIPINVRDWIALSNS